MTINQSKYAPRSDIEKVKTGIWLDRPRYNALQRYAASHDSSHVQVIREGLDRLPGFKQLHKEEKEAYARNINHDQSSGQKVDIVNRIQREVRDA